VVPVARVRRAHGVRGELRVEPLGDARDVLQDLKTVTLRSRDGDERVWEVRSVRPGSGDALLVKLVGLDDRDDAGALKGSDFLVPADALPALEDDEFWYGDLEGLAVVDSKGAELGTVVGVFNAGASDVATVRGAKGEWMLPIVDDVIVEIDFEASRVVIEPIEGLLEGGI